MEMKDKNNKKNPPIKIGQKLVLTVEGYNSKGEGVCRYQGFAIFVPYGLLGEKIRISITQVKKRFGVGIVLQIIEPSLQRAKPPCEVYNRCGGCQIQHMHYGHQLEMKEQIVEDALQKIGKVYETEVVKPIMGAKDPWYYRNRTQIPVRNRAGDLEVGFFTEGTHQVVQAEKCLILNSRLNSMMSNLKEILAKQYGENAGGSEKHEEPIHHVLMRTSKGAEQALLVLVTEKEDFNGKKEMIEDIKKQMPELTGLLQQVKPKRSKGDVQGRLASLFGKDHITDSIGPFTFKVSAASFTQINPDQTERLYDKIVELMNPKEDSVLVDAYSGIGTISSYLSKKAKKVYGLEMSEEAVNDAKLNAEKNKLANVVFMSGKAEQSLLDLNKEGIQVSGIVLDPPRKGCERSMPELVSKMGIDKIVYVSCNQGSMARDIGLFRSVGYALKVVQPVDLFPQTSHVECVVLMSKVEK